MTDMETMYFTHAQLGTEDIGPLFAHQADRAYGELLQIYQNTSNEGVRKRIVDEAFATGLVPPVTALIPQLSDVERVLDWLNTAEPDPDSYVYGVIARNRKLAAGLYRAGGGTIRKALLKQGPGNFLSTTDYRELFSWLRANYPAGSLFNEGALSDAGREFRLIAKPARSGGLGRELAYWGTKPDLLLLLRAWAFDSTTSPERAVLWLASRARLTKAESAEINDLIATMVDEGRFDRRTPAMVALLSALASRSARPSAELLELACPLPAEPEQPQQDAVAAAVATTIALVTQGKIAEAWEHISQADPLDRTELAQYHLQVSQQIAQLTLTAADRLAFVSAGMRRQTADSLSILVQQMAKAIDPEQLAVDIAQHDHLSISAARNLTGPLLTSVIWHARMSGRLLGCLDAATSDLSRVKRSVFDRLQHTLGGDMQEFHTLISTWSGSLAELADSIVVARG